MLGARCRYVVSAVTAVQATGGLNTVQNGGCMRCGADRQSFDLGRSRMRVIKMR